MLALPGLYCNNSDQCLFDSRAFISTQSKCSGTLNKVCECQKISLNHASTILSAPVAGAVTIGLNIASGWTRITGIITNTNLSLSAHRNSPPADYIQVFDFSTYTNIQSLASGVNSYAVTGNKPWQFKNFYLDSDADPTVLAAGTFTNTNLLTLTSVSPNFKLRWGTQVSQDIPYNANENVLAANIQSKMNVLPGLTSNVSCVAEVNDAYPGTTNFHLTFINGQCGISQPKLQVINRLSNSVPSTGLIDYTGIFITEAAYVNGWGEETAAQYSKSPYGDVPCPYEYPTPISGQTGLAPFHDDIQCCPQKGCEIGPNQNFPGTYVNGGYGFENVEKTIFLTTGYLATGCYTLSKFFFAFGKEGRFDDDADYPGSTFLYPDCEPGYDCDGDVATNCYHELFIPFFNKTVSWGPFGSYYNGIEDEVHPERIFGDGYDDLRTGCDYKPFGQIRTRGEYTNTKEIELLFRYAKTTPFFIRSLGTCPSGDDFFWGRVHPSSITSFTLSSGNLGGPYPSATGLIKLIYNCSGKTVNQFIDAVNGIQMLTSGFTGCKVFNFCKAARSTDLSNIPASRINNLSSELFQEWGNNAPAGGSYTFNGDSDGVSDPDVDESLFSGSEIWSSPKAYFDTFTSSTYLNSTNSNDLQCSPINRPPPPCKRGPGLPKETGTYLASNFNRSIRPYWTTMQGSTEVVANIVKSTDVNYDPYWTDTLVQVTGTKVNIFVQSGSTILGSGTIDTNKNGSGYTVSGLIRDLNALSLSWYSNPVQTYKPVAVSTGTSLPFDSYLDDSSWTNGPIKHVTAYGVGTQTTINYGFKEPLSQLALTSVITQTGQLESWIRRRCGWSSPPDSGQNNSPALSPCVPISSPVINFNQNIDCGRDTIISGNYLATYGCAGTVCKTEWFIKAQRSTCSTLEYCEQNVGIQSEPHPFNRTTNEDCEDFSSPTLYICQNNIRPDCDLPFLIKVPYQYLVCQPPEIYVTTNETPCSLFSPAPPTTAEYNVPPFTDYCSLGSSHQGWCQYIDPLNVELVKREDIPATWPPQAYIMERATKPFCTNNINPFDLPLDMCPEDKYDAIGELLPSVPPEYIFPKGTIVSCAAQQNLGGYPITTWDGLSDQRVILIAYIRPIVKDFYWNKVCGGLDINTNGGYRIDIDTNTRCCGCGFGCNDSTGATDDGPQRSKTFHIEANYNHRTVAEPVACGPFYYHNPADPFFPPQGAALCQRGCDDQAPAGKGPCIQASKQYATSIHTSYYGVADLVVGMYRNTEGYCFPNIASNPCCWGQGVIRTDTSSIAEGNCGGQYYISPCGPTNQNNWCDIYIKHEGCEDYTTSYLGCGELGFEIPYSFGCVQRTYNTVSTGCAELGFVTTESISVTSCTTHATNPCGLGVDSFVENFNNHTVYYQGCGNKTYDNTKETTYNIISTKGSVHTCSFDSISYTPSYNHIVGFDKSWDCGFNNLSASYDCTDIRYF